MRPAAGPPASDRTGLTVRRRKRRGMRCAPASPAGKATLRSGGPQRERGTGPANRGSCCAALRAGLTPCGRRRRRAAGRALYCRAAARLQRDARAAPDGLPCTLPAAAVPPQRAAETTIAVQPGMYSTLCRPAGRSGPWPPSPGWGCLLPPVLTRRPAGRRRRRPLTRARGQFPMLIYRPKFRAAVEAPCRGTTRPH